MNVFNNICMSNTPAQTDDGLKSTRILSDNCRKRGDGKGLVKMSVGDIVNLMMSICHLVSDEMKINVHGGLFVL